MCALAPSDQLLVTRIRVGEPDEQYVGRSRCK